MSFISSRQSYTATAIIQYTNANASQGKNADGSRIDPTEITSASVINQTIQQLGLTASTESIRSKISVKEVIPEDEQTKKRRRLPMVRSMNITPLSMPFRSPWPARTPPTTPAMCWTRC